MSDQVVIDCNPPVTQSSPAPSQLAAGWSQSRIAAVVEAAYILEVARG